MTSRRRGWLDFATMAVVLGSTTALAPLNACGEQEEDSGGPPPVVGSRPKSAPDSIPADTASERASTSTSAVQTASPPVPARDSSADSAQLDAAANDEQDAGVRPADGGAGSSSRGTQGTGGALATSTSMSMSMSMSGSGPRAGGSADTSRQSGGRGGVGGRGGTGGASGAAGRAPSCANMACFTVFDCWFLVAPECNYTDCVNFVCQ